MVRFPSAAIEPPIARGQQRLAMRRLSRARVARHTNFSFAAFFRHYADPFSRDIRGVWPIDFDRGASPGGTGAAALLVKTQRAGGGAGGYCCPYHHTVWRGAHTRIQRHQAVDTCNGVWQRRRLPPRATRATHPRRRWALNKCCGVPQLHFVVAGTVLHNAHDDNGAGREWMLPVPRRRMGRMVAPAARRAPLELRRLWR